MNASEAPDRYCLTPFIVPTAGKNFRTVDHQMIWPCQGRRGEILSPAALLPLTAVRNRMTPAPRDTRDSDRRRYHSSTRQRARRGTDPGAPHERRRGGSNGRLKRRRECDRARAIFRRWWERRDNTTRGTTLRENFPG